MRAKRIALFFIPLLLALLTACAGGDHDPSQPQPQTLSYEALMQGFKAEAPFDNSQLAPPQGAPPPGDFSFEGRLELLNLEKTGGHRMVSYGRELDKASRHLPEFDFEFVQSGEHLIPVRRGLIVTGHPAWDILLEAGRVWKLDSDQGYLRASFPFALIPRNGNSTHNGVMIFLFNEKQVSKVWYQVTQETSTGMRADLWGLAEAVYHPGPVAGAAQVRSGYAQEVAQRFPSRPFHRLASDYPGVDISAFTRSLTPEHLTTYGLVIDGVHYRGECRTRYGNFPYCDAMRLPSFSTAKSAFVSLALMRLAQKYDPQVGDLLVKDFVPEAAAAPGDWNKVTFNNLLDMASGNFRSPAFMQDEDGQVFSRFFEKETYADRMAAAFDFPTGAPPGAVWVYHSSDTFILTAAMQNYLRSKQGPQADLFQFVVDEVYRPLHLGPGVFSTLRTSDDHWQGQALGASGLWWIADDIAKIGVFLNVDHGAANGEQILHPARLASALQQDSRDPGLTTPEGRYNDAFWANPFKQTSVYGCTFYVPYMSGYSGVTVALMPNGAVYYAFNDNREFIWNAAVSEAHKIRSQCVLK